MAHPQECDCLNCRGIIRGGRPYFEWSKAKHASKRKKSGALSRVSFSISDAPPGGGGGGGAGGGKSRVPVGRTSPRGRRFGTPAHSRSPRSVIIKSKYVANNEKSLKRLNIWLGYCTNDKDIKKEKEDKDRAVKPEREPNKERQEKSNSLREKEFFSKDKEGISKEDARIAIESNFGKRVAYHQMILSAGDREVAPQEYARSQMQALEEKLGHKLTWVANIHRDTGPDKAHINVTIAGAIPDFVYKEPKLPYQGDEIDLSRVDREDKFQSTNGQWFTKFHSRDELQQHSDWLWDNVRLDQSTFKDKLCHWIGTKQKYGDNFYGTPPLKDKEKEKELGGYNQREIDLEKIQGSEKIQFGDVVLTKFDPLWKLELLREQQEQRPLDLGELNTGKLTKWIEDKQRFGDDVYGLAPMREHKIQHEIKGRLGIDLEKVPTHEQVKLFGHTYTKYDSLDSLKELSRQANRDEDCRLDTNDYKKIRNWMETKQRSGEDVFGQPPMKELEFGEKNALDKRYLEFQFEISRVADTTDRVAFELTKGKQISPQGAKYRKSFERAARFIENDAKQSQLKTSWNNRGDVYIDRESLETMRTRGNYEVHIQRNFDREIDKSIERELGVNREREHDRQPEVSRDRSLHHTQPVPSLMAELQQSVPAEQTRPQVTAEAMGMDTNAHSAEKKRGDDDGSQGRQR